MTKEEILEYIFLCISYKHNNDISPYITKSACEKENLLFENAIEFLDKLEKENAELKAYNEKLLDGDIEKHNKIVELQNRNGELAGQKASLERWLGEAKEKIKYLLGFIKQEGYRTRWDINIEQAQQFLKECE